MNDHSDRLEKQYTLDPDHLPPTDVEFRHTHTCHRSDPSKETGGSETGLSPRVRVELPRCLRRGPGEVKESNVRGEVSGPVTTPWIRRRGLDGPYRDSVE